MRRIRIGTRGSRLALIQTEYVEKELKHRFADVITERVIIHTEADKDRRTPLYEFKGTGVFAKELESALLEDRIDIAVHSAEDMAVNIPDKLTIAGALEREDVRDVLVYRKDIPKSLDDIKQEITIGTDSPRRKSQIEKLYPLIKCESIRGNVPTRIAKVKNGEYDGYGMLKSLTTTDVLIGVFKEGKMNGEGFQILSNGDRYDGSFQDNKFNGYGVYQFSNGDIYKGNFIDGYMEGKGELIYENGDKYVGNFIKGERSGKGTFYFGEKNVYQGDFLEDKFHGEGVLFKGNGDMIEGHFEKGLLKGKATFYPKDDIPYDINTEEDIDGENDNNNQSNNNSTMETTCSNIKGEN